MSNYKLIISGFTINFSAVLRVHSSVLRIRKYVRRYVNVWHTFGYILIHNSSYIHISYIGGQEVGLL